MRGYRSAADLVVERAKVCGLANVEILRFPADGKRSAQQIANELSAEFGAVPVALVIEYLKALEAIKVLERVR